MRDHLLTTKQQRVGQVPTKDFLGNSVDIGDVVLIPQHSNFIVGKVISLQEKGIVITCERKLVNARKWNKHTQQYEPTVSHYVSNTTPWHSRHGIDYIKEKLEQHNAKHRIPIYRKDNTIHGLLNLTKLNIL